MTMESFAAMMEKKYGIRKQEAPEPDPPPAAPAIQKTKPNKQENQFMIDLMILRNSLAVRSEAVKDRLKQTNKYAWRDLRLLASLVSRVQDQLISTMPASRLEYYSNLARNGRYHLDIEGPVRQGRQLLISDIHLAQLCETAMENECIMCLRDGKEIEKCPVRKALLEVAPPSAYPGCGCEYRDAAGDLVNGREVRI